MPTDMLHDGHREKQWVALTSVLASLVLTVAKIVVGVLTGSLGVLSEAAHSGLDLLAAGMTLFAVRASAKPADEGHTYGHGKVENLSALFETLLLAGTCVWIVYEACRRLFFGGAREVDANIWAFLVILLSIVIDVSRSRALMKAAKTHNSQALEADALHFSTDIWSSTVVLLGLLCVALAKQFDAPWLLHADSAAALGVALIVFKVCLRLGRASVNDLLDWTPSSLREDVRAIVQQSPGIIEVRRLRVRRSGPDLFADVTVAVAADLDVAVSHATVDEVERRVKAVFPAMDAVVHVEPAEPALERERTAHPAA